MLRVHCVQLWYDMSNAAMEDLLYEVESARRFAGRPDVAREIGDAPVPADVAERGDLPLSGLP